MIRLACMISLVFPAWLVVHEASAQQGDIQLDYQLRDTRAETRRATLLKHHPVLEWGPWFLAGPFDNTGMDKHDIVYQPELGFDGDAVMTGKGGQEVRWRKLEHVDWDKIGLTVFSEHDDNNHAIAYLWREVVAPADMRYRIECGSDDGLKIWVNGVTVVDADLYRGMNVSDHQVFLPLKKGVNTILVKVTQGEGGWEFQMRPLIDERLLARLEYLLDRDFPTSEESRHYRIIGLMEPRGMVMEVGGIDILPDGRPVLCTRRGDVYIIEGAYEEPPDRLRYTLFASGLHEPLGLHVDEDGSLLLVQRGELTRLRDLDGDDRADQFETITDEWGLSGNYHEFAYGPEVDGDGRLWVTLNLGFCGSLGKSIVPWRGWAIIVGPDGSITPVCGGLRSPNGIGVNAAGDMFFTDNQGDYVGTCKLSHMEPGDFHGHPGGNNWYPKAGMEMPSGPTSFKPPAIWFPYGRMGQSASDIELDVTEGRFGPFSNQLFVGDQTNATVMRVFLEKVEGVDAAGRYRDGFYQGACFPFLEGFDSGVNRLAFAPDGSLIVGCTNRGWGSLGIRPWGVQRVVHTGVTPFEIERVEARPDGFVLRFTEPVDPATASDPDSYDVERFTYHLWERYGSPEVDTTELSIRDVKVFPGGTGVRLRVRDMKPGYVHAIEAAGLRNQDEKPLLHPEAYYTLSVIPTDE